MNDFQLRFGLCVACSFGFGAHAPECPEEPAILPTALHQSHDHGHGETEYGPERFQTSYLTGAFSGIDARRAETDFPLHYDGDGPRPDWWPDDGS